MREEGEVVEQLQSEPTQLLRDKNGNTEDEDVGLAWLPFDGEFEVIPPHDQQQQALERLFVAGVWLYFQSKAV